jgi:hypothetical protein
MQPQFTFTDGIIQVIVQLAPVFILICVVFIIFSWLRVAIDVMSGRGF